MLSTVEMPIRESGITVAPRDPRLFSVYDKVLAGERLDHDDAIALFETNDLLAVGAMADWVNRNKNGDRVFFVANQHLNPTNVCILRATCTFCSFARTPKEDGAYTMTLEEALAEADVVREVPVREFHIVGGLHPKLRVSYYEDLLKALKERHPRVEIKALTAVEIAHLAKVEKISVEEVLTRLVAAGLDSMPGGGAEVFSMNVRQTIASRKLQAD